MDATPKSTSGHINWSAVQVAWACEVREPSLKNVDQHQLKNKFRTIRSCSAQPSASEETIPLDDTAELLLSETSVVECAFSQRLTETRLPVVMEQHVVPASIIPTTNSRYSISDIQSVMLEVAGKGRPFSPEENNILINIISNDSRFIHVDNSMSISWSRLRNRFLYKCKEAKLSNRTTTTFDRKETQLQTRYKTVCK